MQSADADELMRRRSAIVEHPFGTLKCRAGYRHFLLRGFNKVRGEWSLMALCYNFTRVLNILGFEHFIAAVAKAITSRPYALADALESLLLAPETFEPDLRNKSSPQMLTRLARLISAFLPSLKGRFRPH